MGVKPLNCPLKKTCASFGDDVMEILPSRSGTGIVLGSVGVSIGCSIPVGVSMIVDG